eukprot:1309200-Rhodomonas_salina.1
MGLPGLFRACVYLPLVPLPDVQVGYGLRASRYPPTPPGQSTALRNQMRKTTVSVPFVPEV